MTADLNVNTSIDSQQIVLLALAVILSGATIILLAKLAKR